MLSFSYDPLKTLNEEEHLRECKFPGCKEKFFGRGVTKYCKKHRDPMYYDELYNKDKVDNNNQIIQHNHTIAKKQIEKCKLEGCNHDFEVVLLPRVYVYPKFCPEHRNEYKRIRFLQNYIIKSSSSSFSSLF